MAKSVYFHIDEVARVYGYDHIPASMPRVRPSVEGSSRRATFLRWSKRVAAGTGLHEAMSFAFVAPEDLAGAVHDAGLAGERGVGCQNFTKSVDGARIPARAEIVIPHAVAGLTEAIPRIPLANCSKIRRSNFHW